MGVPLNKDNHDKDLARFAPGHQTVDDAHTGEWIFYGHSRQHYEGECLLCHKQVRLHLGHIIPRWAIRMLSKGTLRTTYEGQQNYFISQDGGKEYLFCNSCEQHLGEAENYLAKLCRGTKRDLSLIKVEIEVGGTLHGVNQRLMMRALLGLFYKAHFSRNPAFRNAVLDRKILPSIRRQLLSDDYALHSYYTEALKWFDWSNAGLPPRDTASISISRLPDAIIGFASLGGMLFRVNFKSSNSYKKRGPQDQFLREGRPWNIFIADIIDKNGFEHLRDKVSANGSRAVGVASIPLDRLCPCGLSEESNYGDCCYGRWYPSERRSSGQLYDPNHRCIVNEVGLVCGLTPTNGPWV